MSDEQQDLNLEDVGAGAEDAGGPRKGGLLSGMLLTILKWAAIGIGAVIIIVTVTVITFKIISKGNQQQGLAAMSPEYKAQSEPWASFDGIDQIRGQTADDPAAIFLLQLSLSYDPKEADFSVEIGNRKHEIQDMILRYISQKTATELKASNWDGLKQELKDSINSIMTTGKIKEVNFLSFIVQP
jgi:flagellar protein FliL